MRSALKQATLTRTTIFGIAAVVVATLMPSRAMAADQAAPAAKADPAKAQQIVTTVCAACHGADGNSTAPANPSLAGQHLAYLETQLKNFKSGERKNALMSGMAANLTPEDMKNLAAYYAWQKLKPQSARDKALAEQGRQLYRGGNAASGVAACAGCHGPTGAGIPVQYPRLAGQYADYNLAQLKAFRAGERVNVAMQGIAARLTDQEMKAVSEYIAGLR